tara:strand:+ start:7067 stop:7984 length:918 start_codon:yes stop_codon:yes gene_type:complete
MAIWQELITTNNIGAHATKATFVDKRHPQRATTTGIWNRQRTCCPYISDATAFGLGYNQGSNFSSSKWSVSPYILGRTSLQKCALTSRRSSLPDETFNAGNTTSEFPWRPQITSTMLNEAIFNPWQNSSMRLIESRLDIRYPDQDSYLATYDIDLTLSWCKIPYDGTNTHQELWVDASLDSLMGTGTSYIDETEKIPVEIIGGDDNENVVICNRQNDDVDNINANYYGYQTVNSLPSHGTGSSSDNLIEEGYAVVPILGNRPSLSIDNGMLDDDFDAATMEEIIMGFIQWQDMNITLTTVIQKED